MRILNRDESMGGALWKVFYLNIPSKLWCSYKNSFLPTPLVWILSLGKKPDLLSGKNSRLSQMSKRELAHILPWRREFMEHKPLTLWKKQSTWISCHTDGDLKNIALRAGLASPNQLRHGSAQASLALLIWLKRWMERMSYWILSTVDLLMKIAWLPAMTVFIFYWELSACKISYRS